MKTVSFQGIQLSQNERLRLDQRKQVTATFLNPILKDQIEKTLQVMDARKERGVKPEKVWFLESEVKGTFCFAEWMGY